MIEYFLLIVILLFVYILYNNIKNKKREELNEYDLENNYQPLINTWIPLTCDTYYQNCRPRYIYSDNYYYPI